METLRGSDKFRQLWKKLNHPNPSSNVGLNHDTSIIRKSNRAIKKPVKYDASPHPTKVKESKSKDESERQKNKTERSDVSGKRKGEAGEGSNKSRERLAKVVSSVPVISSTRGKQQNLRKISGEHGGRSSGGNNKSRERTTGVDSSAPAAGLSRDEQQDLFRQREEMICCEPSSPQRSSFRVLANAKNQLPSTSRQIYQEPTSQLNSRRNQDHESSYVRRQRDLEFSHISERRGRQDYEPSYVAEKRMVDIFSDGPGVFAKPHPVSSNQPRWRPNATQNYDVYSNIRQPVVKLVDVLKAREREVTHSRMAMPPPDYPKRFEGGFLRPPTPPGISELVQKEESTFIATLSKFKHFTLSSTIELIFLLSHLENTLIQKMSKTIKKSDSAQSLLRMTMMESLPEDSSKSYVVQSWLKSNDSVAPQRWVDDAISRKRRLETTRDMYPKKMRLADDEDLMSYTQTRQPHHTQSRSLLQRMEDRRNLDSSSTPINHFMD